MEEILREVEKEREEIVKIILSAPARPEVCPKLVLSAMEKKGEKAFRAEEVRDSKAYHTILL